MRSVPRLMLAVVILCLVLPGCTRSRKKQGGALQEERNPADNFIQMGPRTRVLTTEEAQNLVGLSENGEMVFQQAGFLRSQQASLPAFAEGDILVLAPHSLAPEGALRKVKGVAESNGQLVVQTEAAALTEAIQAASVRMNIPLDPTQAKETLGPQEGIAQQDPALLKLLDGKQELYFGINDYVLVDVDGNKATKNDQVLLSGNLGVDAGAELVFHIESFELKEVSFSIQGSQTGSLTLTGTGSTAFKESANISLLHYTPIVLTIGGFPLVITPSLGIALGAEGSANGKFRTSAKEEAQIKIGVGYRDEEFEPIHDATVEGQAEAPSVQTASLSTRAFASIRGNISLYGSTGAYAGMEGFARFHADLVAESCYKAEAGVATQAGLFASILGLKLGNYDKSWDLISKEIGGGSCNLKGATGQDPQAYSWLYEEPSEDDDQRFPNFDRAVDEGLILARSRNRNGYAMKLAPNGAVPYYQDSQSTMAESFRAVKALKDGGMVIAGSSTSPVVIRLDAKGAVVWSYFYKLSGTYLIGAVSESAADGSLVVGGQIYTSDDVNDDMFLMKLSATGELIWAKRLKGPYNNDMIEALAILADGKIAVAGSYGITSGLPGIDPADNLQGRLGWVAIFDGQGNLQRSRLYSSQAVVDLAPVDEGLVLLGYTERTVSESLVRVPWLMRLKADGSVLWSQGLLEHVLPQSVFSGAEGILVSGIRNFTFGDRSKHDGWLAQLSSSGNVLWARSFGSDLEDGLLYAFQNSQGRIMVGGYHINGPRRLKPWFLSLPANGVGSFREGSGFTSSNNSAALFTPPLSYVEAPLTIIEVNPLRENWDRILKPGMMSVEDIAGP